MHNKPFLVVVFGEYENYGNTFRTFAIAYKYYKENLFSTCKTIMLFKGEKVLGYTGRMYPNKNI